MLDPSSTPSAKSKQSNSAVAPTAIARGFAAVKRRGCHHSLKGREKGRGIISSLSVA
jgi:hypothetical protein